MNKTELLKRVDEDYKVVVSKILDKLELSNKTSKISCSDFLDMYEQKIVDNILKSTGETYYFEGGYPSAERKVVIIKPEKDYGFEDENPICVLNLSYNTNFETINHRDILGSIMSKGVKREKIGDIIVGEGFSQVVINTDIVEYIIYNLERIKHVKVKVSKDDIKNIKPAEIKYKEITASIPSLRLDCIVEAGFNIARSKASQLISSEKVFVNWEMITKPSFNVKEGDTVSVRKMGRVIYDGVKGTSRKDRMIVNIRRLI